MSQSIPNNERLNALRQQYFDLCHAMQTGVAFKMEHDRSETSPKHLRVGVNSAMVEHAAIVKLLLSKGIISEEEYYEALVSQMQAEISLYQTFLKERLGSNINLL